MATKRRVTAQKRQRYKITPRASDLFRQMRALPNCRCVWGPLYYNRRARREPTPEEAKWGLCCPNCEDWWNLHNKLHDELRLLVGYWPVCDHPPDEPPYDEIAGGRTVRRNMSHAGGPAHWDKDGALFAALMAEVQHADA